MSAELREEEGGKILVIELSGKLAKEDYANFTPQVERAVKDHGKVRMLVWRFATSTAGPPGPLWEDIKFDLRHFSDIERLALVGDKRVGGRDGGVLQAVHDRQGPLLRREQGRRGRRLAPRRGRSGGRLIAFVERRRSKWHS